MHINAAHILVETLEKAQELKARIVAGENFHQLAAEFSKCPSGKGGGFLGFFDRGRMVKEFEDAAFNMKAGEISEPVKTQFGYHLINRLY